jgi:hypothetical protein
MAVIALLVAGAAAATNLTQRMSRLARTDVSPTSAADLALTTVPPIGDSSLWPTCRLERRPRSTSRFPDPLTSTPSSW